MGYQNITELDIRLLRQGINANSEIVTEMLTGMQALTAKIEAMSAQEAERQKLEYEKLAVEKARQELERAKLAQAEAEIKEQAQRNEILYKIITSDAFTPLEKIELKLSKWNSAALRKFYDKKVPPSPPTSIPKAKVVTTGTISNQD